MNAILFIVCITHYVRFIFTHESLKTVTQHVVKVQFVFAQILLTSVNWFIPF